MILIQPSVLNYSSHRWRTAAVICDPSPGELRHHFEQARIASGLPAEGNRLLSSFIMTPPTWVTTVFQEDTNIVLAQIETVLQDGCCPPVHTVLAHQTPS